MAFYLPGKPEIKFVISWRYRDLFPIGKFIIKRSAHIKIFCFVRDVYKRQVEAHEKGGAKAAKDIEELVSEVTGMFAGGELSEDAIEGAYKALTLSLIHIFFRYKNSGFL